jgi:Reverse transcriptase (RNA-dependent DNA polymerase)
MVLDTPQQKQQSLHVDLMFVNTKPYLVSVSYPMGYAMVKQLKGKKTGDLLGPIQSQVSEYVKFGYDITGMHMDGETAVYHDRFKMHCPIPVDLTTEHDGIVERKIRTIKERVRGILNTVPFGISQTMEPWLVNYAVSRINLQPISSSGSELSPRERLYHRSIDARSDFKHGIFDYVQVHLDESDNANYNGMRERTSGALALMPVGNQEGAWYYLLLRNNAVVKKLKATRMPMPDEVISFINGMSESQSVARRLDPIEIRSAGWREILGGENLKIGEIGDTEREDRVFPGVPDFISPEIDPAVLEYSGGENEVSDLADNEGSDDIDSNVEQFDAGDDNSEVIDNIIDNSALLDDIFGSDDDEDDVPSVPIAEAPRYELRSNRGAAGRWARHGLGAWVRREGWKSRRNAFMKRSFGFQMSVQQGLDKLGDKAMVSIVKEMTQMVVDKPVWEPVDVESWSRDKLKRIITSSMFLKEKYTADGVFEKLKSRLVAGGHLQDRAIYSNGESPTVSTQAVFMVAAIAAMEKRAVCTIDVPGAFLNGVMDETKEPVYMKLNKFLTSVVVNIDPSYATFVRKDGTCVVKLTRALYGCVESARIWYDTIAKSLGNMGFVRNSQDMCVFNRTESCGSQTTLVIHVDDMLITGASEVVLDMVIAELEALHPDLSVHRGKKLNYLGMVFDFSVIKKCKVTMEGYVSDLLRDYESIVGVADTPAVLDLFSVDGKSKELDAEGKEWFHSLTAKLLYLGKRVRPDLLTACSFLTKRVQAPTDRDRGKACRVIRYLRGTAKLGIVLEGDKHLQVLAWIDASYGVHEDMRSHTGSVIGIGKGPIYVKGSGQKLNTKSSTEAELVGLSDSTGQVLWTRNFLVSQGYELGPAKVYQDNQSTIALVKNGKSNSERTRHIAIRFFFIADRVASNEIEVEYMPTGDMLADILTKPLSGALFIRLRDSLLNWYE